jgi:3-keto-disaccharide hydrolase
MKPFMCALVLVLPFAAAETRVDLTREEVGKPPTVFEPIVGTWVVAQDGGDKVVMVDGRPWVASKDNPTKLLVQSARKLYGTSNEELMDNAKQFAYYPVAVLKGIDDFTNGTISLKFKTIAGDADRASGILFNVKANGDWLAVRYNDTENNVALWEFHNGIRRGVKFSDRTRKFMLDRSQWHELKMTVDGASFQAWLDGQPALDYTLGSEPGPGRNNTPPNADLFPANNPVLRPPVAGKVGLWAKTDSTSYFKDYVVAPK